MPADVAFALQMRHGTCVGVRIPASGDAVRELAGELLLPEEARYADGLAPLVRRTWVGGRVALRDALARIGAQSPPVLRDPRGAPDVPAGIAASITHKETLAAALVARESSARIGVDLEMDVPRTPGIAARILTLDELAEISTLPPIERDREVLLRFSAKEAIYKAIDPFVRRFVGFHEVAVRPRPGGDAEVTSALARGEGPFAIDVCWRRFDGLILTSARVSPSGTS